MGEHELERVGMDLRVEQAEGFQTSENGGIRNAPPSVVEGGA